MPDPTIDKLLDRIEVLENALKEIKAEVMSNPVCISLEVWLKINEIATKALWPM